VERSVVPDASDRTRDERPIASTRADPVQLLADTPSDDLDFGDVRGQAHAERALEIAAAGGHHVLLIGTILSRRIELLVQVGFEEAGLLPGQGPELLAKVGHFGPELDLAHADPDGLDLELRNEDLGPPEEAGDRIPDKPLQGFGDVAAPAASGTHSTGEAARWA
jgi:Magnesium chelatase, subunit ChlI